MTSINTKARTRPHAPLARAVAFVLFLLLTHSATVEVVHRHGKLTSASSISAASFHDAGTDQSTTESSRSTGECLVCQLHQHLYTTLLINVPGVEPPQTESALTSSTIASYLSQSNAPRRGRSPPQTSL